MEENNNPNEKNEQNVNNNTNQEQSKITQPNGGQPMQQPVQQQGQGTQVPNMQGQGTQIPNAQGQGTQIPNAQGQGTQTPNMNQPPKKKSKAGLIIAIILGVLVLLSIPVIILLVVAGKFIFSAKSNIDKVSNSLSSYYNEYNYDDYNYNSTTNNTTKNTTKNTTTNNTTTKNTTANNTITNNTINNSTNVNTNAKASTKDAPLKINQWGLASKYVSKYVSEEYADKSYIDVPVRVTKVTRGDEAVKIIKDWCDTQSFYKYQDPKAYTEWAVFEYEVDLNGVKFDDGTLGTDVKISSGIKGLDGGTVKYNDISYSLITTDISGSERKKSQGIYKGKFIVMLPEGCKDYLVKLGDSYNGSESYFRVEE
ncbi:MAG: hypothetical protein IJH39_05460 [Clostridia bacterium]|nr:hypothetical protein [Clostridia bacterium]